MEKAHIVDCSVKLRNKVELLGVSVKLEGGNQGTHDLVEDVGLWN